MQSIIKKILLILILGIVIDLSITSLTLFNANDAEFEFQSAIAAETPGDNKDISPESGTPSNIKMSGEQHLIEQKWQLLKGKLRWDVYEILVGTFLSKIYQYREKGIILGQFEDAQYQNIDLDLKSGDRFILYTDGIIEATNAAGDFFGWDLFKEFITSHASLSVGQFADDLIQRVTGWSGKDSEEMWDDDLTLVVADFENS